MDCVRYYCFGVAKIQKMDYYECNNKIVTAIWYYAVRTITQLIGYKEKLR